MKFENIEKFQKVPRLPSNLDQIKELLTLCTADELRLVIASCNGILSEVINSKDKGMLTTISCHP